MWIPTDYLEVRRDGRLHTADVTDYRLPVEPGDVLGLVCSCSRGYLLKKNGAVGWYFGRVETVS